MKKIALCLAIMVASALGALAGESYSGKEVKQVVPPPCPEWYGDNEWNVSIWGTYVGTAEDWQNDEYIEADHGWGGGLDAKYFFHRYFGIGLQGWAINAERQRPDLTINPDSFTIGRDRRLVGSVLGTLTLRFPLHCSRFAPYVWGGAGVMFGGGESEHIVVDSDDPLTVHTQHNDGDPEFVGQVGGGFEFRFTRHVGLINDFSYNFVGKENSDFGMIRMGLNFAF
ncbi:MAG: outer membrane protein beta-barrel domain [Verrucomicrobiota bacterium]|jgi:hypothetical protein